MADAIKFTEEELQTLQNLQSTYNQITLAMGQVSLQKIQLEKREESILNTLSEVREKENTLAKELTDKYGKGSLNIETGDFTPIVEEEAEEAPQE
tara:strand:- start:1764 stop:2048 length:285 start_codon:yes stop_codon:yes gene_type:complete